MWHRSNPYFVPTNWWGRGRREALPCRQRARGLKGTHSQALTGRWVVRGRRYSVSTGSFYHTCLPGSGSDLSTGEGRGDRTKSGGWEGAGLEGRLACERQECGGHWGAGQQPPTQLTIGSWNPFPTLQGPARLLHHPGLWWEMSRRGHARFPAMVPPSRE